MRRAIAIGATALLLLGLSGRMTRAAGPSHIKEAATYSAEGFALDIGVAKCPDSAVGVSSGGLGVQAPYVKLGVPPLMGSVSLRINDGSGTAIMAYVWQGARPVGGFCGSTANPIRLRGARPLYVALFDGVAAAGPWIVTALTVT